MTGLPLLATALALGFAGFLIWCHGYARGLRWNNLEVHSARRCIRELRGQVAILGAGMLRAPADLWDDFDREQRS